MIAVLAPFFWGVVVLVTLAGYVLLGLRLAAEWAREDDIPDWIAIPIAFAGVAGGVFVIGIVTWLVGTIFMGVVP